MTSVDMQADLAHSEIGASSHYRWKACPGSVRLSRGLPNKSSAYAEEGTLAHTVCAEILEFGAWPKSVAFDAEMNDAVQVYIDYIQNIIGEDGWCGSILVEHKFDLGVVYKGLFGTADCVIYDASKKLLRVIDYKHGAGIPVEAVNNSQLLYYGLGALITLPYEVESVELTIVQPRCNHPSGPIRTWLISAARLFDFAFEVYEDASRTEDINAPLNPGEHCRFCKAVAICPKLQETTNEVARREFASNLSYDPVLLSDTLEKLDAVEAWAKGVRAFAYSEAEHGRPPPGWKLVQKRATRKWKSEEETSKELAKLLPDNADLFDKKIKSPAAVEKLLPKNHKAILASLVVQESSGYALAREDDPRPAAKLSAIDEFEEIETDQTVQLEKL